MTMLLPTIASTPASVAASAHAVDFGRADTISSAFAQQQPTIKEEELDTSAASAVPSAASSRAGSLALPAARGAATAARAASARPAAAIAAAPSGGLLSVNSITTPGLAAAIVQQASMRPQLSNSPEALADAAAFAAQVIRPTATDLLGPKGAAAQWDENDAAELVIVAEPEAATVGSLHPRGSLYEKPVNADLAKAQHAKFRQVLAEHGVRVLTVRDILAYNVEERLGARLELEALAASSLTYKLADGTDLSSLTDADLYHLSDDYKAEVVSGMSTNQLIEICLINPTVTLSPTYRDTGLSASYAFEPLTNLVFTRDQQVTTGRGVVMARLRSAQRQKEVALMEYCFKKLGINIAGAIEAPGFLEGGDFFPLASRDLSLVGVGLRSNLDACKQLMDRDLLGTRRLAVVRDDFDRNQDRMHLDCVFSVLGERCCLMLDTIMGTASPLRRLVDEYAQDPRTGKYLLVREGVEFSEFIRGEGFEIVPISHDHQLAYACNVLNLGRGRIVSVHAPSARQILQHPAFRGDVQVIDFGSVTSMYGSVHCASQVIRRAAPATARPQHPSAARAVAAAEAKSIAAAAAASAAAASSAAAGAKKAAAAIASAAAAAAAAAAEPKRPSLPDALKPIALPTHAAAPTTKVFVSTFASDECSSVDGDSGCSSATVDGDGGCASASSDASSASERGVFRDISFKCPAAASFSKRAGFDGAALRALRRSQSSFVFFA